MTSKLTLCLTPLFWLTLINFYSPFIYGQTFISEIWDGQGGSNLSFTKSVVKTDFNSNVYSLSSTINSGGNYDFLLQKRDPDGVLVWEETYSGAANGNDIPADLVLDQFGDVYVTGTCVQDTNYGQDLVVLKYNSGGNLLWSYIYVNPISANANDIGSSLFVKNNKVFVTGVSSGNSTQVDYLTISVDANFCPIWDAL